MIAHAVPVAALLAATSITASASAAHAMTMNSVPQLIIEAAQRQGLDPRLAVEVGYAESRFDQSRVSPVGAIGVMQLLPATAAAMGVDPHDLRQNIEGGVRYLKQQLQVFGDTAQALGAYNCGPACVAAALSSAGAAWLERVPTETKAYVRGILSRLGQWAPQAIVSPATIQQAQATAEKFRNMPRDIQQILLLLAIGVGLYTLARAWTNEED